MKKRFIIKWIALAIILSPVIAQASYTLNSLEEVKQFIMGGNAVRFVIHYNQCKPLDVDSSAFFIADTYTPNKFTVNSVGGLLTTQERITEDAPGDSGKLIHENVRYYIRKDNVVNITFNTFDLTNYKQRTHNSFDCKINEGISIVA